MLSNILKPHRGRTEKQVPDGDSSIDVTIHIFRILSRDIPNQWHISYNCIWVKYDTVRGEVTDLHPRKVTLCADRYHTPVCKWPQSRRPPIVGEYLPNYRSSAMKTRLVRSWKRNEENKLWALFTLQLNKTPDSSILVVLLKSYAKGRLYVRCEVFLCAD